MSRFPAGRAWLGGVCLAVLCGTAASGTEVYQWVDRNGVTRYTLRRDPGRPKLPAAVLAPIERAQPSPVEGDGLSAPAVLPGPSSSPPAREAVLPMPPLIEETEERLAAVPVAKPALGLTHPQAERIRELEARIEADRESLKQLISRPSDTARDLSTDPRVLEIGQRLPRLQAELRELREAGP